MLDESMGHADTQPTRCPRCGRQTKTVDGVCPECWAIKDTSAIPPLYLRAYRAEPTPTAADLVYGLLRHVTIAVAVAIVIVAALLYFGGLL
jgi:hypothetical protein